MRSRYCGFTIAELITVVAVVTILAAIALPVTRFANRRQKEIALRARLQRITSAIDKYHDLRTAGVIKGVRELRQGPYPKNLDELATPIELIDGKRVQLLRQRDLIDPMTGRSEWRTISSIDNADALSTNGDDVFDVHSTSTALSLDGKIRY